MPLLFMMILPQINLCNTMISQAANGLQGGCFVGEEEATRRLSGGQDAPSFELNIDPFGGNRETSCQLGYCQMVGDRRPPCLPMLNLEAVFKTNALDRDRQDFVHFPWRVMSFLRQNVRDLVVMHALASQRAYALHHLLVPRQGGHGINR